MAGGKPAARQITPSEADVLIPLTNTPATIANARRIVSDPATCHASPTLARLAWLIIHSGNGRPAIQSQMPWPERAQ